LPHPGNRCVCREYVPAENRIQIPSTSVPSCAREQGRRRHRRFGEREEMLRETGMAELNGARIYYEVAGEGDPLVLVHAGIADSRMWEDQLMAFADRYRVIRYDMRGFGMTAMVEGPFSHHEDLRALLDALDAERAHLVGCSMGGGAVLDFALEYPQKVGNLVLVGSAVGGFGPDIDPPRQRDEILAAEEAGDLERVSELEVQVWVDGPGRFPEDVDASVRDLVREMNLIALRNEASGLGDEWELEPPAADRLPDVRAQTLLIIGDEDQPRVFAGADLLERELPNVRKVVMHGTAHVPNMERPEEFNRIVLDFLRDYR
jgi:pimeloyl-ACP methyl ester carboxylesterase